jgi:hypothetical protein
VGCMPFRRIFGFSIVVFTYPSSIQSPILYHFIVYYTITVYTGSTIYRVEERMLFG